MSINKEFLNDYFANHWPHTPHYHEYSNIEQILTRIKDTDQVLDVGCGYNDYKVHLNKRLYAFDPAINSGDELTDIENFDPKGRQWDVVLCLGSINFGTEADIKPQVKKVVSLVKPGGMIIWRQNPGHFDHDVEICNSVPFYPWTLEQNEKWADEFGCKIEKLFYEKNLHPNKPNKVRIYSEWIKL